MKILIILGRGARLLLAGVVLIGIEGGVPYMLVRFAGLPIPRGVPSWTAIERLLLNPIPDQLLLSVLAVPLWLLWAAFSVALIVEITALARGVELHVPLLGPLQAMAAGLLGSMAIAVLLIDLRAASTPIQPAAVPVAATQVVEVDAAVDGAPHKPREPVHVVKPRDSLWKIAGHRLGSGLKWRTIWKLNGDRRQVDGQMFTDPDVIQPGWRLRLPDAHRSQPSVQVEKPPAHEPSPPAQARAKPTEQAPSATPVIVTIDVPSGGIVALSAVAGMCAAQVLARFHRRRRRVLPSAAEGVTITPEPDIPPVIEASRRAYNQLFREQDQAPPSEAELVRAASTIEVPDDIVIGVHEDGSPVRLSLSGMSLGLAGPGALDVVRGILVDLLHQAGDFRVEVLTCAADAARLLGVEECHALARGVPGLTVLESMGAALDRFEEIRFTRRRMLAEREAGHVEELRQRDPGEALPVVILVVTPEDEVDTRLGTLLEPRCGMGALLLGDWPAATCQVAADHSVSAAHGQDGRPLTGANLVHLPAGDLVDALRVLGEAQPDAYEQDAAVPPVGTVAEWEHPTPVWVQVMGRPAVLVKDHEQPLRIRGLKLSLLVYLALHPRGATKEAISEALWPGKPPGHEFHSLLRHLRDALETATGLTGESFVVAMDNETYRVDAERIGFDLWEFQREVKAVRVAADTASRLAVLDRAARLCVGELGSGLSEEWILEERYPLTLAQVDVLTQLAELCDDHERNLELLDQARRLDPDTEEIWCRIMRLHQRLGYFEQARLTGQLLLAHLRTLHTEPTPATAEVLAAVLGRRAR
ncbi:LysM peptidoglycan-binding domain-containing protein [Nonomuraea sp. NPDC049152]|uniref:LysM peptidoglycan-binding domain-containing protein n=1 Tax=Nonomuraea sp. NPDC049152 TaxID=3154350 RepID=UPI0033DDC548